MKKITAVILSLTFIAGCGKGRDDGDMITIAAAASMKQAAEQLAAEFMKTHRGKKFSVISSASGTLVAQIINGAPFDIFMSADINFPASLKEKGYAAAGPDVYARGTLVLFSRHGIKSPGGIQFLAGRDIKRIAVANPDTAPYGRAALESMAGAGIKTDGKLITAMNVVQAASYGLGTADAAFISKSALHTVEMERYMNGNFWIEVDQKLYSPVEHGMVIVKNCRDFALCIEFRDFVLSAGGRKILKENGFNTD